MRPSYAAPTSTIRFASITGAGTTCSQAAPCSLSMALSLSIDGDTIYVAAGTYTGAGNAVIAVNSGVALLGGWNGAASGPIVRNSNLYPTILNGQDARRVITISPAGSITPTIDGFIITHGNAKDLAGNCNTYPTLFLFNGCGGGILVDRGGGLIQHNVFSANLGSSVTGGYGGAIAFADVQNLIIRSNTFINNAGSATGYGQGGAIFFRGGVSNTLIQANQIISNFGTFSTTTSGEGGGIASDYTNGPATIDRNTFSFNAANKAGTSSGHIYEWQGQNIIQNNLFSGTLSNAALSIEYSDGLIQGNQIYGAPYEGLSIQYGGSHQIQVINNILSHNGGYELDLGGNSSTPLTVSLINNTIVANGYLWGAGIRFNSGGYVRAWLTNTLITGAQIGITNENKSQTAAIARYTMFESTIPDRGNITFTNVFTGNPAFINAAAYNYHIGGNSSAINAGILTGVPIDIDGDLRLGKPDIGADEAIHRAFLPITLKNL